MLSLSDKDRVRVLAAVDRRGAAWSTLRVAVITASLAVLFIVPAARLVRIDLWSGEHWVLGERVDGVRALGGFLVAMMTLYGATFLSNMVVGRFFCGWGCPVGYVSRLGEDVERRRDRKRRVLTHLAGAGFVATFVAAVMSWWVSPRVFVDGSLRAQAVVIAVFLALAAGGFAHAFGWRFGFCRSVCPIGLYYRYVTSKAPIGILFSQVPDPCIACGACERICPVDLDPKNLGSVVELDQPTDADAEPERYGDAECLRCGDCIEACRMVFAKTPTAVPPLRFGRTTDAGVEATEVGASGGKPFATR